MIKCKKKIEGRMNRLKFYIASSFQNKVSVKKMAEFLNLNGFELTYDWTKNDRLKSLKDLRTVGEKEKNAVKQSDFFIMMLPAGKGSHIEYGIALGLGKRIYLYSPNQDIYDFEKTSTFYHLEKVTAFVGTIETFLEEVMKLEKKHAHM